MKKNNLSYLLLAPILFLHSCHKDPRSETPGGGISQKQLVKKVSWNVTSGHSLTFVYNQDSTIQYMESGSKNLPTKYRELFEYKESKILKSIFEKNNTTLYSYAPTDKINSLHFLNQNNETGRHEFTYNNKKEIVLMRTYVAPSGIPVLSSESSYSYTNLGLLNLTVTKIYDEHGRLSQTLTREFKSHSPAVDITPHSLLHPLYQHRVSEVFNIGFLSNATHLPVEISETGDIAIGPVTYTYKYILKGKSIDKVSCFIKAGTNPGFETSEARFEY